MINLVFQKKNMFFFEYLASKVNFALEETMHRIEALPKYELKMFGVKDLEKVYSMKRKLEAFFRRGTAVGQVTLSDKNGGGVYAIIGEIPTSFIDSVLKDPSTHERIRYTLNRVE